MSEQAAILESPASPHNDPLVKALYQRLPHATNLEAAEIGLALQRVLRGENLDDTDPEMAAKYRQYMANADATVVAYEKNKERFITSSLDEAVELTDAQKAVLNEQTQKKFKAMKTASKMNATRKKVWMQDQIKNGPKVEIYVEPQAVIGRAGQQPVVALEGIVIGLNGVRMYLPPGKNMVHPLFAQRYEQIMRGKKEQEARQQALQRPAPADWVEGSPDGWSRVAEEMHKINKEFGSSSGSGESGERWDTPELTGRF